MQEPLCLVQNGADGVLSPNPVALEVLCLENAVMALATAENSVVVVTALSPLRVPQEQEALLQEGSKQGAEALREQIKKLEKEKEEIKKGSWIQRAPDGHGSVANPFLPGLLSVAFVALSGALMLMWRVL